MCSSSPSRVREKTLSSRIYELKYVWLSSDYIVRTNRPTGPLSIKERYNIYDFVKFVVSVTFWFFRFFYRLFPPSHLLFVLSDLRKPRLNSRQGVL